MTAFPTTRARALVLVTTLSALALAACSGSIAATEPAATVAAPTLTAAAPEATVSAEPSATPEPSASEAVASPRPDFTPVPTDIDPCTLMTQAEASTLVGFQLAAGTSTTLENNDRLCSYGAEGTVVEVLIAVLPDAATAKAGEPDFKATLEQGVSQAGIVSPTLTDLPEFDPGVDATMVEGHATVGGTKVAGIALYALKDAVIISISDIAVGTPAASAADLQAQAHTTLARLP